MSEFSNVFSMEAYKALHCFEYVDVFADSSEPSEPQAHPNQVDNLIVFPERIEPDNLIA